MHDIDRTLAEIEPEMDAFESDFEFIEEQEFADTEAEGVFDEAGEIDMASQLLEVADEAELDQFLGSLFRRVGQVAGRAIRSPVGRYLGGQLRGLARRVLPMAGGALGTLVGGPAGGMAGSQLASMAGQAFGLEIEGLSQEDQSFEVARRFVRFAGEAAKNAALSPATTTPQDTVKAALAAAAKRHAPGILRPTVPAAKKAVGGKPWIVRRGHYVLALYPSKAPGAKRA